MVEDAEDMYRGSYGAMAGSFGKFSSGADSLAGEFETVGALTNLGNFSVGREYCVDEAFDVLVT